MRKITAWLAASLCGSAVVLAQPPTTPSLDADSSGYVLEEEIVVTAQLDEAQADEVGASVTVIGREEIERRHETTVLELLRTVPGLALAQNGGLGTTASVFVRGANSSHTLVLVDGVRVNATGTGAFDFGSLTVESLERIEVLRGPQSTLYGSEALGGVVSLVTRRGAASGPRLGLEGAVGSDDFRRLSARTGGAVETSGSGALLDWTVGGSRLETDGISAASESAGNTEDDGYEDTHLSARVGWDWGDDARLPGRLDLTVRDLASETEIDGFAFGFGPVDDPDALQDRDLTQASLALELLPSRRIRQRVQLGYADETLIGSDPTNPFNEFTIDGRVTEARSLTDFELPNDHTVTAGLAVEERRAGNLGTFDEDSTLRSVFTEYRGSADRLVWTAGLRHDDDSRSASELTYRLTAVIPLGPTRRTRFHGSFGTGFRTPSFNERFFPGAGNPALVPETSRGWDFGVEHAWAGDRMRLDVTAFDLAFDELIVFDLATFLFGNVAEASSRGIELTGRGRLAEPLELAASYTWNETEDEATGLQLARRPEHRATLQLVFDPADRWSGTAALVAVRDRIDSDTLPLDDYERLDLGIEYRWTERFAPYLRLDNLLDEDYEEVRGFTTPGRTAQVGLKAGW